MTIDGTGKSATFTVNFENLVSDLQVSATSGLEVSPKTVKAGSKTAQITVTNLMSRNRADGQVILRSGDERAYVKVEALGTPLEVKDIASSPAYSGGTDAVKSFDGVADATNGYTIEFKAKIDDASQQFTPYAVTGKKVGFQSYVTSTGMGMNNGANVFVSNKSMSNPYNGGTFYNTDGLYHTYRYAVTPDERVFVYRDGMAVDTFRVADLALQPDWSVENGDMQANLIKNPGFEGEWDFSKSRNIVTKIEGWDVYPYDQYNSTQNIETEERDNDVDQNNHVLSLKRYMWSDGWSAGQVSQIVDVAPNETYSFSALAKGGIKKDGTQLGSLRIEDLQNSDNKVTIPVTSDNYQTYAADFTTLANTKQIRVVCYLERDKWGASISALKVDDVKLTGMSRNVKPQIGFRNEGGADVKYFAYDNTGAYAPAFAQLAASTDKLTINGTGASETFTVDNSNLSEDIQVAVTNGFAVKPTVIKAGSKATKVTVTHLTTKVQKDGQVILRSGDFRTYVAIKATGSALEVKDISANPVYAGGNDTEKTFEGFVPGSNGYSVEVRAKVDDAAQEVLPFAVSADKVGFKSYINSTSMGMLNSRNVFVSNKNIKNPANGGTFYNTDGLYHTYRYAVTSDARVFVYRDGLSVDSFRVADLALQPEWSVENGKPMRNLLKNPGFEGEWELNSDSLVTKIEGWDVYPYDRYNSTQEIVNEERSNEVDQNNHVLALHRYMWSDGWSAGQISQIVDVAPNEVYSFSALAKGGIKKDGTQLASLRIEDLQNSDNKVTIPVTSDDYQTYSADFSTLANTKQIRVICYLERDKWGASISALKVDDVKLTGYSRNVQQQIGFENNGADIKYFAFDNTGAYAPVMPGLTAQEVLSAIEKVDSKTVGRLKATVNNGMLLLQEVADGSRVMVYNASGSLVATVPGYTEGTGIALPGNGIYVVAVFKDGKRQVTKVRY